MRWQVAEWVVLRRQRRVCPPLGRAGEFRQWGRAGRRQNNLSHILALAAGVVLATAAWAAESGVKEKHPVFVGARACAKCHEGPAAGNQFSLWRASRHAQAYAALWSPQAKEIARLSGILEEPQKSPVCLGCHATASDTEAWEKEDTFVFEDGVQCERCHGPGSEYMAEVVMRNRAEAMANGLKLAAERDCMACHAPKGSHVAVLKTPVLDVKAGMARIAHPVPKRTGTPATPAATQPVPTTAPEGTSKLKYTGVMACAACHEGPAMGYQFSRWRVSGHARAYAVLGTPAGRDIASAEGMKGDPQTSPDCLRCHTTGAGHAPTSFLPAFDRAEGVQCEGCHGPGSEYSPEAVMRDKRAAKEAGLLQVGRETCLPCHENAHGRPFDYEVAVKKIAHPTRLTAHTAAPGYKTPLNLALSPDGKELYVACEASDSVVVVDVASRRAIAEIPVGGQPHDVAFTSDGARAYVSNRLGDSVSVIDTANRRVVATIGAGDEPHGLLLDEVDKNLYVLNAAADSISVINTAEMKEVRRLAASVRTWSLALSPDGSQMAATNALPRLTPFRTPPLSEVTIIDTGTAAVVNRVVVPGANLLQGIDWHPSGEFAIITLMRNKNLVPMTRILQGWTITNGMGVVWRDGKVDQVLLDEPGGCFPDPADVAISPDGRYAFVTSSGSDRVAVVDIARLLSVIKSASAHEREHVLPNHLGKPTEFVVKHIPTKNSPRGVRFSADGKTAYVADALDDSVTVIDVAGLEAVDRIDLGGPKEITQARWGERLFHSARIAFHRQFSCHSCHPDGHVNGLTYDIEPDGVGILPVDNRTLRGILDTAPFKWEGTNPTLERECGPRLAVFFTRIQPFTPDELSAVSTYICTIPRPPNRYRPVGGALTPAQRRGKAVFERTMTNDHREIPLENRCVTCHFPPLYTDRSRRIIGPMMEYDDEDRFDVPHLNNIYDSAPYLHNGAAHTLEEIWTRYNPYDQHGVTNDMTKDQLNDLVEYLKTL